MAKKIRFPLKMKNGAEVRTLDELKEIFDLESVLGYFTDGRLTTWLADRYYDEKAEAVSALSADMPDLNAKLCEILEVEYQAENDDTDVELIARRREKLRILSNITDDKEILDNVDLVAMDQDELFDILDESPEKVYLYSEKFSIPFGKKNITYIGLNSPTVILENDKGIHVYSEAKINFKNVAFAGAVNSYFTSGEKLFIEGRFRDAFPLIEQAANNGNPRAMYIMARYYCDGYEVVKINKEKRNSWCERAYSYKEPLSMYVYAAWCLKDNSDEQKNIYASVFKDIKLLAESGDILAQGIIGYMYDNGCGVVQDKSLAVKWMIEAANQGYPYAQNYLGWMYDAGNGIDKDKIKAVEWYRKAAEQGYANAQCNLGVMYNNGTGVSQDYTLAIEWYTKAAEQGNAVAQCNLGYKYEVGQGVEKDYTKAVEWYRKAAEQGYANAQCNLGVMYNNGTGVSQDYTLAIEWYTKAAEQGNAAAQCNLGYMYEVGQGVEKDYTKAAEWYRKSAVGGLARAQCNLGVLYRYGNGVPQNNEEAVNWYRKAAEQGYTYAECNLGEMYAYGWGVLEDKEEAVRLYRKAAEKGYANAQSNLGYMYEYGYGVVQNKDTAIEWYRKAAAQGHMGARNDLKKLESAPTKKSLFDKVTDKIIDKLSY